MLFAVSYSLRYFRNMLVDKAREVKPMNTHHKISGLPIMFQRLGHCYQHSSEVLQATTAAGNSWLNHGRNVRGSCRTTFELSTKAQTSAHYFWRRNHGFGFLLPSISLLTACQWWNLNWKLVGKGLYKMLFLGFQPCSVERLSKEVELVFI